MSGCVCMVCMRVVGVRVCARVCAWVCECVCVCVWCVFVCGGPSPSNQYDSTTKSQIVTSQDESRAVKVQVSEFFLP